MKVKNKRSHKRSNTALPVKVRRLPPTEREGLACRIVTRGIVIDEVLPPRVKDEHLNAWLSMLNAKLDYLIRLSPLRREEVDDVEIEPLDISGGGMSLATKEHFTSGEILEIRMVIQAYPPKVLYLYGRIMHINAVPGKPDVYTLGIEFLGMPEEVRNEILRFDFKAHRQKLLTEYD
jgi:hypothetical protein